MSRSWPYLAAVAVVGVLAGAAIGGRPEQRDDFVISPEQIPTTTIASVDTLAPISTLGPISTDSTPADSTPADSTPADSTPADSTPADSTPADSTPAQTARIVLADGSGADGVLADAQGRLAAGGFDQIASGQVAENVVANTVYYRAGFVTEAAQIAVLLGVDQATLVVLTDQVVTDADDQGDVVVVLGPDVAR